MNSRRLRYRSYPALLSALLVTTTLIIGCSDDDDDKETCVSKAEFCTGYVCEGLAAGTCVENDKGEIIGRVEKESGRLIDENGDYLTSSTGTNAEPDSGVPNAMNMDDDDDDPSPSMTMDTSAGDCTPSGPACPSGSICKESVFRDETMGFIAATFCVPEDGTLEEGETCSTWSNDLRDGTVVVDPCGEGLLCAPELHANAGMGTTFTCKPHCLGGACEGGSVCLEPLTNAFGVQLVGLPTCIDVKLCDLVTQEGCEGEMTGCSPDQELWDGSIIGYCEATGTAAIGEACGGGVGCAAGGLCLQARDATGAPAGGSCLQLCAVEEASADTTMDVDAGVAMAGGCSEAGAVCQPLATDNAGEPFPAHESQSAIVGLCVPGQAP